MTERDQFVLLEIGAIFCLTYRRGVGCCCQDWDFVLRAYINNVLMGIGYLNQLGYFRIQIRIKAFRFSACFRGF